MIRIEQIKEIVNSTPSKIVLLVLEVIIHGAGVENGHCWSYRA